MQEPKTPVARRALLGGAAVAGAAATVAALVPARPDAPVAQSPQPDAAAADKPLGYQLTDHVKRYYATARV